ncbi:hypothetical protein SUGI_1107500 [Cryptomeria japonica]|nr:hypothetical protein SUGI_1107500 [Cryptomeria japonica]
MVNKVQNDSFFGRTTQESIGKIKTKGITFIEIMRKVYGCLVVTHNSINTKIENTMQDEATWFMEIVVMGMDKAAMENIVPNAQDTQCIIWKESIKWKDTFLKQNIKEQGKLLKDCNCMLNDIAQEFTNIGCQIKRKDNSRDATTKELKVEFQNTIDTLSNPKAFN